MELTLLMGVQSLGGIVVCSSTYMIFSTIHKHCNIPLFLVVFSYADFLTGAVLMLYGLEGVAGITDFEVPPFDSWGNFSYILIDNLQILLTISFALSRLILAIFPSFNLKALRRFNELSVFFIILLACICLTFLVRAYFSEILFLIQSYYFEESLTKKMVRVWIIKTKYFAAVIAFVLSCLTWFLLFVRLTNSSWSYNVLRSGNNHLSVSLMCLGRSFFFLGSEAVSLEFLMNDYTLRLMMSRLFYVSSSTLLFFLCLLLFFPNFLKHLIEKTPDSTEVPKIQISEGHLAEEKQVDIGASNIWSTGVYCIGQMNFEHHEARAERERSVSFYREVRGENDILLQKLREAQDQRRIEKEERKIRRQQNSNLLAVPTG